MANIKSQLKDIRQNEVRRQRNMATRSTIKTLSKKALSAEATPEDLKLAVRSIDKAVNKGVLKKNTAARKKSHLMRNFSS